MKLVLLGVGNAAQAVLKFANANGYNEISATTRSVEKKDYLQSVGVKGLLVPDLLDASVKVDRGFFTELENELSGADVLVSFPPDGQSDSMFARYSGGARKIVYISTTGVFGGATGPVDEQTPVDPRDEKTAARIAAEDVWKNKGAVILRAPGLYGPATGLHIRLKNKAYKLPGEGKNHISRIHLDDLAKLIFAAFKSAEKSSVYVAGDLCPAQQVEVVRFLCDKLNLPMPESMPIGEAHSTVRGDRQVMSKKILKDLGVTLSYPTYKEGYEQCLKITST